MNIKDIKKLTPDAPYRVNVSWDYLESHLEHYGKIMWDKPELLQLDPDFQRGHVWDEGRQIAYVEYCLRGGKSSRELQFNCAGWMANYEGPLILVDGKQRMEAVRKFMRNELPVFGGHTKDMIENIDWALRFVDFVFNMNSLKTRAQVLQWYLELNSGGIAHEQSELDRVRALLESEKG